MNTVRHDDLLGVWHSDPTDSLGQRVMGRATLEFRSDGTLRYTAHEAYADQVSILTFRIENGWLITDQPSSPSVEKTRIEISPQGQLILEYDNVPIRYIRP
jgi:hypothetical protein